MANSLIPYSFVPGTKAMASEVNANFIALARAVDDAKTFTTEAIEQFNTSFEEHLDESLGNKLEVDLSNCKNISNCILEVPQRIKIEQNNGILTLKSGSVLIMPNGFEDDGATRKFDYVTIENDISLNSWGSGSTPVAFVYLSTGTLCANVLSDTVSGTTCSSAAASSTWYDTANNIVKYSTNAQATYIQASFPIFICARNAGVLTSMANVFNGMGFIGQHTWVDKDLRVLFADGRNSAGSLKNIEVKSDNISIWDLTNQYSQLGVLRVVNGQLVLSGYGPNTYFEQEIQPTGFGSYALWYNTRDNCFYDTGDGGTNWTKRNYICIPKLSKASATGSISDISMPYALKIADMNDIMNKMPAVKSSNGYMKLPNGIIIQWGSIDAVTVNGIRAITFPVVFSATPRICTTITGSYGYSPVYQITAQATTGFTVLLSSSGNNATNCTGQYIAIGY